MLKCMDPQGKVRGYYSGLLLDPTLVNDMKCHLSEDEFWGAVEHLGAVGLAHGKITPPLRQRKKWTVARHYDGKG